MVAETGKKRARVAFVNTHPIQYFSPLYRYINQSDDIEAVPVYLSDHGLHASPDIGFGQTIKWDVDLLSGTNPIFAKGAEGRALVAGATKMLVTDVWRIIRSQGFDAVVVHGHRVGANHIAWAAAKSKGIPIFTRGETHQQLRRAGPNEWMHRTLMPWLYRLYTGMLAIGTANAEFYRSMGVADRKISLFPYSVDNARLMADSQMTANDRAAYRAKLGLTEGRPAVLFCSKFQRRKHADDVIRACAALVAQGVAVDVVMAGAGEMDAELRALAAQHRELTTIFTGFINQSELPKLFGACDIFTLPSENEPWGLIVNEAMCAGLPVVAAREIGCVRDLVHDGKTGMTYEAGDIDGLVEALRPILNDPALRTKMGQNCRDVISRWSYAECLVGLRDALTKAGRFAR
jgi:glycosyltransferase involved in cell wall biosynthesis